MTRLLAVTLNPIAPAAGGYKASGDIASQAGTLELLITNAVTVMTIVGGIMFMLYFLLGALQWVSAGGDKGKIEKAKGMLTNSAIGIIVLVLSYSIIWIVGKVVGIDILNPATAITNLIKFK